MVHKFHLGSRGLTLFWRTYSKSYRNAQMETRDKLWGCVTWSWHDATILKLSHDTYLSYNFGQITNSQMPSFSNWIETNRRNRRLILKTMWNNTKLFNMIPNRVIWSFPLLSCMYPQIRTRKKFLKKSLTKMK